MSEAHSVGRHFSERTDAGASPDYGPAERAASLVSLRAWRPGQAKRTVVFEDQPGAVSDVDRRYRIALHLSRTEARLDIGGQLDAAAAPDLCRILASLEILIRVPVEVDLCEVVSVDAAGLTPLLETARRRAASYLPPLLIITSSEAITHLMQSMGVAWPSAAEADAAVLSPGFGQ